MLFIFGIINGPEGGNLSVPNTEQEKPGAYVDDIRKAPNDKETLHVNLSEPKTSGKRDTDG